MQRNTVTTLLRKAKSEFALNFVPSSNPDAAVYPADDDCFPTHIHLPRLPQLLKLFTRRKTSVTFALLDQEDRLLESDDDKAELFNDFFVRQAVESSVSSEPLIIILPRVTAEDEILHEF